MTAIEYALIAALIAVFIIGALMLVREEVASLFEVVADWVIWVASSAVGSSDAPPPGSP